MDNAIRCNLFIILFIKVIGWCFSNIVFNLTLVGQLMYFLLFTRCVIVPLRPQSIKLQFDNPNCSWFLFWFWTDLARVLASNEVFFTFILFLYLCLIGWILCEIGTYVGFPWIKNGRNFWRTVVGWSLLLENHLYQYQIRGICLLFSLIFQLLVYVYLLNMFVIYMHINYLIWCLNGIFL